MFKFLDKIPKIIQFTFLILFIEKILTIDYLIKIFHNDVVPLQLEIYLSNIIVIIISSSTIFYLLHNFIPSVQKTIKRITYVPNKYYKLITFVDGKFNKIIYYCLIISIIIYSVRLLIIFKDGYEVYPYFFSDVITVNLIQTSILFIIIIDIFLFFISINPVKVDIISDYSESYGLITNELFKLTLLFAINVGYYYSAIIKWATAVNQEYWLLLFTLISVLGVLLFFVLGISGSLFGASQSRILKIKSLKQNYSEYISKCKIDDNFKELDMINPDILSRCTNIESNIALHAQIDLSKQISYFLFARIFITIAVTILTTYLQLYLQKIL